MNNSNLSILDYVKQVLTSIGAAIGIAYALGFVIATAYLLHFGISDISFARVQYISIGITFLALASFTVIPTAWVTYYLVLEILQNYQRNGGKLSLKGKEIAWNVQSALITFILYILIAIMLPNLILIFVSSLDSLSEVTTRMNENRSIYYGKIWTLLPEWYLPLVGMGVLTGEIILFLNGIKNLVGKSILKPHQSGKFSIGLPVMTVMTLVPLFAIVAVNTYSMNIYPNIKPAFGGGNLGTIQFVTDNSGREVLGKLLEMEDCNTSVPVQLLGEGGKYYSVLKNEKAVMIEKSLIMGIKCSAMGESESKTQ